MELCGKIFPNESPRLLTSFFWVLWGLVFLPVSTLVGFPLQSPGLIAGFQVLAVMNIQLSQFVMFLFTTIEE